MRMTGIILLVLGLLFLGYMVYDLFDPNGRDEAIPFMSQNWAAILAAFLIGAGAGLLVASQDKYKRRDREKINY
ncbi:MAG: hypothetical protein ACLFT3_08455 [Cyclobacteriaceae bacterium]